MPNFPRNPYEVEHPDDFTTLPKDEHGHTIVPTEELLRKQLEKCRELAKQQWPERVWDQR